MILRERLVQAEQREAQAIWERDNARSQMEVERVVRSHRNKQSGGGKQHLRDLMH